MTDRDNPSERPSRRPELEPALSELEDAVRPPVVPGEGVAWCEDVAKSAGRISGVLERVTEAHAATREDIEDTDLSLLPRVEELDDAHDGLRERWEELDGQITGLRRAAEGTAQSDAAGTGSREPLEQLQQLREDLLQWIVDMRAHDAEVRTWLVESVYRDRGIVD